MIPLFFKFTSGSPEIRGLLPGQECFTLIVNNKMYKSGYPFYLKKEQTSASSSEPGGSNTSAREETHTYTTGPWRPLKVNPSDLNIGEGQRKILRLHEKRMGLADILTSDSRIKDFRLRDAVVYSLLRDMRFVQLLCLIIGFSLWWIFMPQEVLSHPGVLTSPDIGLIVKVARDTFQNQVCSVHQTPSPCDCGEVLNKGARLLLETQDSFDPMGLKPNLYKVSLSVFVGAIVLSLALAESICHYGFRYE